jgi:hypothetical protein
MSVLTTEDKMKCRLCKKEINISYLYTFFFI